MSTPMFTALSVSLLLLTATLEESFGPDARTACLARAEQALEFLEQDGFAGSYLVTSRSVVAKLNGKDREETLEIHRVSRRPGEPAERQLLRRQLDGEPVAVSGDTDSDQHGLRIGVSSDAEENTPAVAQKSADSVASERELKLPVGADAELFQFSATRFEQGLATASFEPAREHRTR